MENYDFAGKRISVIGAGVSGRALAELAVSGGASVFVSDSKELAPEIKESFAGSGIKWEEGGNTDKALEADENALRRLRAQAKKAHDDAAAAAPAAEVAMTAASVQRTDQEKILDMLDRFHKRN